MMQRRSLQLALFSLIVAGSVLAGAARARDNDHGPARKAAKVRGKWRIAWNVRLGTVRGILTFRQSAEQVTGTFEEYGQTFPLSGNIRGRAITFDVPFSGALPYTIEFQGTVDGDGDRMTGVSSMKGGGHVFLGHAGEQVQPERPWTATKGLKRPNNSPDQPPEDDDDDHPKPAGPGRGAQ